jgi:hypothetical protein
MNDLTVKTKYWHELTSAEKKVIKEKDWARLSIIKGLPPESRTRIYKLLYSLPSHEMYGTEQKVWLKKEIYFANKTACKDLSHDGDFLVSLTKGPLAEEFRIDYALRHLDQIEEPWNEEFAELVSQYQELQ